MNKKIIIILFAVILMFTATVLILPHFRTTGIVTSDTSLAGIIKAYEKSDLKKEYKLDQSLLVMETPDSVKITLGDQTSDSFIPNLEITRWEDEVGMKIIPSKISLASNNVDFEGNKITFKTPDKDYAFYPTANLEGGYEFDVILKEKPANNVFEFNIETKGLDFFYQSSLNQEKHPPEIVSCTETQCFNKDGKDVINRPENVVGSYAVYHSTKSGDYSKMGGKNYRAGKFGHIYRPKVTDASGKEVWGILNINKEKSTLSITVPQEFLDKAIYPVTIDPEIGNTGVGGTSTDFTSARAMSGEAILTETGTITSISMYLSGQSGAESFITALYSDSSNVPNTLLATGASTLVTVGAGWKTSNITDSQRTAATFHLASMVNAPATFLSYYDNTGGYLSVDTVLTYGNFANPFVSAYSDNTKMSIYATYTSAAAGSGFAWDNFTSTDGTLLENHTPNLGGSWTKNSNCAGTANTISINANTAYSSGSSADPMFWYVASNPSSADYSVSADIYSTSSWILPGPAGRISTSACTGVGLEWYSGVWLLSQYIAGDRTYLSLDYTGDVPTIETPVTAKLEFSGSNVSVYLNNVLRIGPLATGVTAAGKAGVFARSPDGGTARYIDNWTAADYAAPPGGNATTEPTIKIKAADLKIKAANIKIK